MIKELDLLKLVCNRLEKANITYMLTGSFAGNFYAVPRMTRDIDIVIKIDKPKIDKIFQIFKDDFYVDIDSITEAVKHRTMFNIIHNDSIFKIDFIICKNFTYRLTEFQRRQKINLNNDSIWIVAPEDLIISKMDWAKDSLSDMQLKDVKNLLLTIQNLDYEYILKWVDHLKLNHIYNMVKNNA